MTGVVCGGGVELTPLTPSRYATDIYRYVGCSYEAAHEILAFVSYAMKYHICE